MDRHCVLSSIENSTSFFWSISSFCDVNAWRRRRNCLRCLLFNVKKTNILQMPRMKNRHTLGLIIAGTKWNSGMKTRRASSIYILKFLIPTKLLAITLRIIAIIIMAKKLIDYCNGLNWLCVSGAISLMA